MNKGKIIIALLLLSCICEAQSAIEKFDLVMESYNLEFTSTEDPKEKEQINAKYEVLISQAEKELEESIEKEFELENEKLLKEEEDIRKDLEVEIETTEEEEETPIEGVHICYFKDTEQEIIDNKNVGTNHNKALEILGLKKSGNEKEKVKRIIEELTKRGFR